MTGREKKAAALLLCALHPLQRESWHVPAARRLLSGPGLSYQKSVSIFPSTEKQEGKSKASWICFILIGFLLFETQLTKDGSIGGKGARKFLKNGNFATQSCYCLWSKNEHAIEVLLQRGIMWWLSSYQAILYEHLAQLCSNVAIYWNFQPPLDSLRWWRDDTKVAFGACSPLVARLATQKQQIARLPSKSAVELLCLLFTIRLIGTTAPHHDSETLHFRNESVRRVVLSLLGSAVKALDQFLLGRFGSTTCARHHGRLCLWHPGEEKDACGGRGDVKQCKTWASRLSYCQCRRAYLEL